MEKKDKKQRDIVLSQDNALTTARYKFDLIEKRALYSIIRNIRAQYIENENGRRDLFDDLIITIHEEELKKCGDNTKMQNIYDALKRLRNRDIEINNEKMWLSIGFVNYVKHIKNKSYFEVQVSKEVLPYYVELAQKLHELLHDGSNRTQKHILAKVLRTVLPIPKRRVLFLHSRKASGNVHVGKEIQTGMRFQKACT